MVDANYAYDRRDARRVGRELEGVGVEWFEEPVRLKTSRATPTSVRRSTYR